MIDHLYDMGFTIDGIIFLCMLTVCVLAWIGNEGGE
jgi:hypothetical protein